MRKEMREPGDDHQDTGWKIKGQDVGGQHTSQQDFHSIHTVVSYYKK